jgi:hypothetical protein
MDQAVPGWDLALTAAQIQTALGATAVTEVSHVLTSINVDGYVAAFFLATIGGVGQLYCAYSTNGGASWSYGHIFTPTGSNGVAWSGAADYVPHLVGGNVRLYVGCGDFHANLIVSKIFRSDNGGASWSALTDTWSSLTGHFPVPVSVHCPYTNNPDGDIVYVGLQGNAGQGLYRSANAGSTWANLISTQTLVHRFGVETWTQNDQRAFFWANNTLLTTDNAFTGTGTATGTGLSGGVGASGGFPYASSQFYALTSTGIFVTIDRGENWINKTGNWGMGFTNPRVIVPVWVSE